MRLFHKIALVLALAAAVPLGTVGFALVARNERALQAEVRARFDQTARHAAEVIASDVEGRAHQLAETARLIGWAQLSADELRGALELVRGQARADEAQFVSDRGLVVAHLGDGEVKAHAPLDRATREGLGTVVFSAPYPRSAEVAIAGAIAVGGGTLALEIRVSSEARRLAEVRGDQSAAIALIDDSGHPIAATGRRSPPASETVRAALSGQDGHARRYLGEGGSTIAAFAPVGGLGWSVIVEEDAEQAFAAPRAMRRMTLLWAGSAGLAAVLLAFVFAKRLTAALEGLSAAARAVGTGALATRVEARVADRADEVGALARTFNQMGGELQSSRLEIEGWNRELEGRVEARTRELKAAQAQLVQAQKLAALGQLGAGVAHEINSPLGGVIGHVQLLLAERSDQDHDYEALTHIEKAARQASQVVQNLLRFSVQHKDGVRTTVDVNKLVRDTLSLTSALISEQKIAIECALDPGGPRLRADAGQIAQVLLNLVSNARTAMPAGGQLRIATRAEGAEVLLAVADTGKGIPAEIRERIFEPFFTTKDDWSNVGLGLSVSYRIVSEHGGRIEVASEPGRGSTFSVWLPAA